ncbi:MAG: T9SS type A sorting domain-containing protein [Chloroherpetonaceae bacterium]
MKIIYVVISFFLIINISYSGEIVIGSCDTLISFKSGTGQNSGQSAIYFPKNIFGLPSRHASETIPETSESEICSLGLDGEIIIGFKNIEIIDGIGPDFTIFENAFLNPINNKIFAEPGKVSVSYDGVNYYDFPYDSLTLEGCAGTRPTFGDKDPFNPNESGGNSFDLSTLGLQSIKYINIKDITRFILENQSHPFYDPTLSGFDLDAVTAIHFKEISNSSIKDEDNLDFLVSTKNNKISIINNRLEKYQLQIFNVNGMKIFENDSQESFYQIPIDFPIGVYFVVISYEGNIYYKKLIIQ